MRKLRHLLVFLLMLLALPSAATVVKPLLSPLTLEQGLSRGMVQRLYLDKKGFLWIGTSSGLNRFDATRNLVVDPKGANLTDLNIVQIYENNFADQQEQLWVAASNVGVFVIDKTTADARLVLDLAKQEQLQQPQLYDVLSENSQQLLVAIDQAVYRFDQASGELDKLFEIPAGINPLVRIRQIYLENRQLWIASTHGLFRLDLASGQVIEIQLLHSAATNGPLNIRQLYRTSTHLYIAADNHLFQLPATQLSAALPHIKPEWLWSGLPVLRLLEHQNRLLLGTNQGLYEYDTTARTAQRLWRFSDSLLEINQDLIVDLVSSTDGGLWLANREDGAFYWHPRSTSFTNVNLDQPATEQADPTIMSGRTVVTMAQSDPQTLWFATNHGLNQFNLATGAVSQVRFPDQLPANFTPRLSRIYPDNSDKLWFRSGSGLHYFSVKDAKFLPPPLQDQSQQAILQNAALGHWRDPQGAFWFYTREDYYHYQPSSGELHTLPGLKLQIDPRFAGRFLGFLPGDDQRILLSAADQLWVYQLNSHKAEKFFQAADFQPGRDRFADKINLDPQGVLWVTFHGIGLLGFDGQSLALKYHFNSDNKLLSNMVYSNELDQDGNLWFAGNYGLSRLDTRTLRLEHFSKKDGLASNGFVFASSIRLSNGHLAFGSNKGLTLFDPSKLTEAPTQPAVVITGIKALNEPVTGSLGDLTGQTFEFSHQALGIEVEFSALNFRDSGKISYRFWLDGEKALEFPEQSVPKVVFPQLKPGRYWFNVVAVSPMTGMQSKPAQIEIVIQPAPWLTRTALLSYGTMGLVLFMLWLRNRGQQQRLLAIAHQKVFASEQRLKQALEAVDSGAWEWHANKNSMYAQRIHQVLGYNEELNPLTMQQHLSLIHPDDRDSYQQAWQRFTSLPDKTFDHTYRMQHKQGHWLWFRDIGKVTELTSTKKIERVIGTYSNITETRATKEKARLFGEAFQQTRDWVVLLDLEQRVIAANLSFSDVFGDMDEYLHHPRTHDLGISLSRRRFYTRLLAGMTVNQHWQGEETVLYPDGTERPTLINITAVGDDLQVDFFVLVFTDITAQKQAEEELRYLASYDALTGLPNRALLMDRIYHGIEQAKRERRSLALCFIDLDKFKQINDSLGHDIGDLLLKKVAKRLTDTLRQTDTVARLGGDEFVVLLEAYKNDDNISHVARKMIKIIGEPMQLGAHTVSVSPSIGIAVYPEDAQDAKELLKHADVAMYHAKDSGRNNFQFFINEMNEKAYMQLARETQLRSAYQHSEFLNYYQPIYDSRLQKIVGVEVLMRWQSEQGLIPPNDFIPLAEDLNLIVPMTLSLLERALADLQQWQLAGFSLYLSVNLATRHLEQADLAAQTQTLLKKYQLPATCLRFEITESALMQDHESAIASMLALSELGIQLALDDFGTGYSSLKYLKELPIDAIKIDRSFVKDIGIDSNDETIIDAMLSMANSLGMYCIAEGVETEQQLAFFNQRQCYLIQGYLFGKPMPAAQLVAALTTENQFS